MKYFKLKNPFKRLRMMFREIDNYYFFMRQLEILADSGDIKRYKLKMNDKHGIYGAINLPPELLLYHNEQDLEQLEKTFFGNEMAKLNDMLVKYEIIELYKIEFERVKDDEYYAYVFCIRYKWDLCNVRSISWLSASVLLVISMMIAALTILI